MVACSLCCLLIVGRRDSVTSSSRSDSVSRASFDENVSFIIIVCVCVCVFWCCYFLWSSSNIDLVYTYVTKVGGGNNISIYL